MRSYSDPRAKKTEDPEVLGKEKVAAIGQDEASKVSLPQELSRQPNQVPRSFHLKRANAKDSRERGARWHGQLL